VPGALWTWNARRRGLLSSDGWVDAVIIEVDGRWFLTDSFVHNPGVALDRDSDPAVIGRAVRQWLRTRPRRPGLEDPPPDEELWATFCREVIGVHEANLQRERSLFVCARGHVFRCRAVDGPADDWLDVADEDAAVGALVVEQLMRQPATSPIAAWASVTQLDGGWRVMATPRLVWTKHLFDAPPGRLLEAASAALDRSAELSVGDLDEGDRFQDRTAEDRVLQQACWVPVARRLDGTLILHDEDGGLVEVSPGVLEAEVEARWVAAQAVPVVEPRSEVGFGPKAAWLAVPEVPAAEVADALGLVDTLPIDADDGVAWASTEGVVVFGPVRGWTLAVGHDLLAAEDLDVRGLSRDLGTVVQWFRTHRVVDVHEWTWAERGMLRRSARFEAGRDPEWVTAGLATPGESDVGLPDLPTEDDVLAVAGEWSIDPTRLPPLGDVDGIWGRLP
jgi:hypothetical protein